MQELEKKNTKKITIVTPIGNKIYLNKLDSKHIQNNTQYWESYNNPNHFSFHGKTVFSPSYTDVPNTYTRKPSITIPIKVKFLLIRFDFFM